MARLAYLAQSDLAEKDREILSRDINLFRALAHSPDAARAFSKLGGFIRHRSRLNPRLRELAILQVGWLARSPYEWSHHVKLGYEFGVTETDIRAMIDETAGKATGLDETSRMVLRGAREMTRDGAMAEETFGALQRMLGDERLVDLTVAIGFYNAVVRILGTLQIDVEPDYATYLEQFPLPDAGAHPV